MSGAVRALSTDVDCNINWFVFGRCSLNIGFIRIHEVPIWCWYFLVFVMDNT